MQYRYWHVNAICQTRPGSPKALHVECVPPKLIICSIYLVYMSNALMLRYCIYRCALDVWMMMYRAYSILYVCERCWHATNTIWLMDLAGRKRHSSCDQCICGRSHNTLVHLISDPRKNSSYSVCMLAVFPSTSSANDLPWIFALFATRLYTLVGCMKYVAFISN